MKLASTIQIFLPFSGLAATAKTPSYVFDAGARSLTHTASDRFTAHTAAARSLTDTADARSMTLVSLSRSMTDIADNTNRMNQP
jgi:hypothetical protein